MDGDGKPARSLAPLVEYAKWLPADAKVILKVPEAITASRRWMTEGNKRSMADNPDYFDPASFTDRFYRPAIEVLGDRIVAFIIDQGLKAGVPTVTVANNRAGGNANQINQRVLSELKLLRDS